MNKEKIISALKVTNISLLAVVGFILLMGSGYTLLALAESASLRVFALGYVAALIFGLLAFKKNYFLFFSLLGWVISGLGYMTDLKQIEEENSRLCSELRAEPSCVETACGFRCDDYRGYGLSTSYSICADKEERLCTEEMEQQENSRSAVDSVLIVYASIVKEIVASDNPSSLDFQSELVAIRNCLKEQSQVTGDGEREAVAKLRSLNLTDAQLQKYYDYLASKGINVARVFVVAGLPNGDPVLSCDYLGLK